MTLTCGGSAARTLLLKALFGAGFFIGLTGCDSPDFESFCDQSSQCRGSSDKDTEACVISLEAAQSTYDEIGCTTESVELIDCLLEKGTCTTVQQGQPCTTHEDCGAGQCTTMNVCETKDFQAEGQDCVMEQSAFQRCANL